MPTDIRGETLWAAETAVGDPTTTISPTQHEVEACLADTMAIGPEAVAALAGRSSPTPASERSDLVMVSVLGEGGMGRVESARQESLGREVAVKRVRPDRICPPAVSALLLEARITGALEHPNIVPVHLLERDPAGHPLLVMKRIEGAPWLDLIRDPDHPDWRAYPGDRVLRHLAICTQVCNAMHFAHRRGVVHRDLKPENVMVGAFGEVYVLDWGLALELGQDGTARATHLAGTPSYMAPEMALPPHRLSARTDVYLIGACLHHALTGRTPHAGTTLNEVLTAVRAAQPPVVPDSVPAELAAICRRAMAPDPADRFESALDLRLAIEAYLRNRASIEVAASALARLAELEVAAAVDPTAAGADGAAQDAEQGLRVRRLGAGAHFGFRHALDSWPDNPAALRGLQRCLELLADYELRCGNLDAARSHVAELPEPSAALDARIAELAERKRRADEERDGLLALARERDVGVHRRSRTFLVILWLSVGVLAAGAFVVGRAYDLFEPTHTTNLVFSAVCIPIGLVGLYVWRRDLLSTEFNRAVVLPAFAFGIVQGALRLLGAVLDVPVDAVLAAEPFLIALTLLGMAASVDASLVPISGVIFLLGMGAMLAPKYALAFSALSLVCVGYGLLRSWTRLSRRP